MPNMILKATVVEFLNLSSVCFFEDTTLFRFYTLVSPNPLRSTLAELKVDGVTRACNLRIPLLRTISSHGYSVAFKLRNFTLK